jgi:hypothetical protein
VETLSTRRGPKRSVRFPISGDASAIESSSGPPAAEKAVRDQPKSSAMGLRKVEKT